MREKISIIIPTYNILPDELRQTIASVISQTHTNLEIIIIDDGSLLPFSGVDSEVSDTRITWLPLEKNVGVARARNKGLEHATGEYIAFLDAGDWWEPEKLKRQLDKMRSSCLEPVLVYTDIVTHTPEGVSCIVRAQKRGNFYRSLLLRQTVLGSCSGALVASSALEQAGGGFYDAEDIPEDRELWLRMSKVGNFDFVSEPLVHLRILDPESRSFDPEKKRLTYRRFMHLYKKELHEEGLYRKALAQYYFALGEKYMRSGQVSKGICNWLVSFSVNPNLHVVKRFCIFGLGLITGRKYSEAKKIVNFWKGA